MGLTKGRLQGFEGEMRSIQHDLQSEMYRDAEKRHRDMSIMLKVSSYYNYCVTLTTITDYPNC